MINLDIDKQISSFCYFVKNAKSTLPIDLGKLDSFSLSAVMRNINKKFSNKESSLFLKIYLKHFNFLAGKKNFEKKALKLSLIDFSKKVKIKKQADFTSPDEISSNLINLINLLLLKIKTENRNKAKQSVKTKLSTININDIANKNMPASSAIGQSLSFVKQVLFDKDPAFIKNVLTQVILRL